MSTLLDEIIHLAEDGKQPLPDLLRKCLRLGHELKNGRLTSWATQELNGYGSDKDLPKYRILPGPAYGTFVGTHYHQPKRIIPSLMLEENDRHLATTLPLNGSISAYSDSVKESAGRILAFPWPANMVGYYQNKLLDGYTLHSAWQEIPASAVICMLDVVRTLTCKMALEIKDELGTSYTDLHNVKPHEAERIRSIVINAVGGNVAVGNIDASGQTIIVANDRASLDHALIKAGLDKSDLNELSEAILVDGGSKPTSNKVSEWIQSRAGKIVVGGVKVGVDIGKNLLTEFLLRYSGLKT
jgi:AbiTii